MFRTIRIATKMIKYWSSGHVTFFMQIFSKMMRSKTKFVAESLRKFQVAYQNNLLDLLFEFGYGWNPVMWLFQSGFPRNWRIRQSLMWTTDRKSHVTCLKNLTDLLGEFGYCRNIEKVTLPGSVNAYDHRVAIPQKICLQFLNVYNFKRILQVLIPAWNWLVYANNLLLSVMRENAMFLNIARYSEAARVR